MPAPTLSQLGTLKTRIIESLPDGLREEAAVNGFGGDFSSRHYDELQKVRWDDLDTVTGFMAHPEDFNSALEYFASPELRIRADCLTLSGLCPPEQIGDALRGWSKYRFTAEAAKLFSYYFCNLSVMRNFSNWRAYIGAFRDETHKWLLSQAYDVQTKGDLLVLMDDLSVRAAITVSPEDTVQDLMLSAYVHLKKEERKIADGVPAKTTAIFEWSSVYCSMFDRLQKVLETVDKESALDSVKTRLVKVRESNVRRLEDYQLAGNTG